MVLDDKHVFPESPLCDVITIVTSYINIGGFHKGMDLYYSSQVYVKWMEFFARIKNPVIAFFDEDKHVDMFTKLRAHFAANMTKIYRISKRDLWMFSQKPKITKIFSRVWYPKHSPNTMIPEYACLMQAKYELMAIASRQNPLRTKYIAWLDIGYFRDIVDIKKHLLFQLNLPPQFNEETIAYSEVGHRHLNTSPETIFKRNLVYISGGIFIGKISTMYQWSFQFKHYFEKYLSMGLAGTDQQVLCAMLAESEIPHIQVQAFQIQNRPYNPWFTLGYTCVEQWEHKQVYTKPGNFIVDLYEASSVSMVSCYLTLPLIICGIMLNY